jgi:CelD/BcsL family acetyltransferase involved in cellulose biosynthesis
MIFECHTSFPKGLAREWNELLERSITKVPFLRYEYLNSWWRTRGGGEWPLARLLLVTARRDGVLVGVAPFMLVRHEGKISLMLVGSIEISDYLDLIVAEEDLPAFVVGLLAYIQSAEFPQGWSRLSLYNIPEDSASLEALKSTCRQFGWNFSADAESPCPSIILPGDWETYLAGIDKKQRHEIRRKMRRAESSDQEVRLYVTCEADQLRADIQETLRLMEMDAEKKRFLTPLMRWQFRISLRCAFSAGFLQLAFLEVGGKKAAVYVNFLFNQRVMVYNSGMDPAYSEYSPGWVLLGYLLQHANQQGMKEFDFMRGDEDYKYKFGGQDRQVLRVEIDRA